MQQNERYKRNKQQRHDPRANSIACGKVKNARIRLLRTEGVATKKRQHANAQLETCVDEAR